MIIAEGEINGMGKTKKLTNLKADYCADSETVSFMKDTTESLVLDVKNVPKKKTVDEYRELCNNIENWFDMTEMLVITFTGILGISALIAIIVAVKKNVNEMFQMSESNFIPLCAVCAFIAVFVLTMLVNNCILPIVTARCIRKQIRFPELVNELCRCHRGICENNMEKFNIQGWHAVLDDLGCFIKDIDALYKIMYSETDGGIDISWDNYSLVFTYRTVNAEGDIIKSSLNLGIYEIRENKHNYENQYTYDMMTHILRVPC